MLFVRLLLLVFAAFCHSKEKVLIISHHCAQPFFVELQAKTFKKFIQDDYEFVIFNDAKTIELRNEIDRLCRQYNIRSIPIAQEIHDRPYLSRFSGEDYNHPCIRCANVVQYSLDVLGFDYPGLVVIIDSDMFFIKPFSFLEFTRGYDLVGVPQSRSKEVEYIWNGLVMLNMETLPHKQELNFNCGRVHGTAVDVGGYTYHYLTEYGKSINIKWIGAAPYADSLQAYRKGELAMELQHLIPLIEIDPFESINMETFLHGAILHYRGGGLWDPKPAEFYRKKNECVLNFIHHLLEE